MKLNYRLRTSKLTNRSTPVVIMIHGLFGSLSNFGSLAAHYTQNHDVIQVDLRNHGHSPHSETMTYADMAQDVLDLLNSLLIKNCIIIGHSMGGKVAMTLSVLDVQRIIDKIIIIDIAPVQYDSFEYNNVFQAIDYIDKFGVQNKNEAIFIMQKKSIKQNIILFLLKSFNNGSWNFNFRSIKENYVHINSWNTTQKPWFSPALFIKGELSSYVNSLHIQQIYDYFPYAQIYNVPNAGHWVHYDQPIYVSNIIDKFILC